MPFYSPVFVLLLCKILANLVLFESIMNTKEKRGAVIALKNENFTPAEIAKHLKMNLKTVYNQIKRFDELGTLEDRPKSGRPVTATTPANVQVIKKRIQRNSQLSMRKMAKDLKISPRSVRRIVKKKLNYHPYKITEGHYLTEKMKANRLIKARKMKRLAAAGRLDSVVFTDEKIFTVERHHNSQNDRQLLPKGTSNSPGTEIVTRSHFPTSVMLWAGICATGKTPLVFVDRGAKINAKYYQERILRGTLEPWARKHFKNNPWTLQQDWAPAHGAKTTMALCKSLFPNVWHKDVWPSNSPDINPMDYSVWGILDSKIGSTRYNSKESLKHALKKAWSQITTDDLRSIINNFPKRLNALIAAKGGHFEKSL